MNAEPANAGMQCVSLAEDVPTAKAAKQNGKAQRKPFLPQKASCKADLRHGLRQNGKHQEYTFFRLLCEPPEAARRV